MNIKPGGIQNILFRAAGTNPAISTLQKKLTGKLDGKPICIGEVRFGEPSKLAFISLEITGWSDDKMKAMAKLSAWLTKHQKILKALDAEKWIEVNTYLLPNQAYEQVGFNLMVMKAALAAGCNLDNTCYAMITPRDSMHGRFLKTWDNVKAPPGKSARK